MVAGAQIADELTVSQLICRLARDQGEAVAIADAEGAVSFRELEEGSRRIAAGLLATGTAKGSKIGLPLPVSVSGAIWHPDFGSGTGAGHG